ncbi:mog-3 [Pristionchus pacificus]|uniref:Mog-3 n=1 Tax=Pristionchus pacificus TaxID=54126 RepID=A0A454Y6U0_PRIPA|nr:mog-3 [Pristionchus pacificus]|eukprot:PDM80470.1 mog-3 [Pristionchus pacificus]
MSEHKGIGWMYDGVKADAHREDYLLGKTIDKNFEKYSDAVIVQKEEAVDALTKTRVVGTTSSLTSKVSSLPLNVMKSEDPLVAIKVLEESKRRDVMENPLTKLRFQKQMKEMMEKMAKKAAKKEKKRKREIGSSDDDSSSDEKRKKKKKEKKHKKEKNVSEDEERGRKEKKRKRQNSSSDDEPKKKESHRDERRSDRKDEKRNGREESRRSDDRREKSRDRSEERRRRRRDSSEEEMRKRKRRDSSEEEVRQTKRRDSSGDERRKRRDSNENERRQRRDENGESNRVRRDSNEDGRKMKKEETRRRDSSEEDRSDRNEKDKKRDFDSHIPAHLRPGSSSEYEREKNDYDKEEKAAKAKWEGYGLVGVKKKEKTEEKDVKNPYELKRIPKFTVHEKSERKKPLTEEEKATRLKEMESNVKWRDDLRVSNQRRTKLEDEKEEKDDDGRPASFVKPLLNSVAEGSMEDRLKQRKKQLQRGHGYMDKL